MAEANVHPVVLNPKRQRVAKACDACRKRKARCDGVFPSCGHCAATKVPCMYTEQLKKRTQPKSYLINIEDRLNRVETLLGRLIGNQRVNAGEPNDGDSYAVGAEERGSLPSSLRRPGKQDNNIGHGEGIIALQQNYYQSQYFGVEPPLGAGSDNDWCSDEDEDHNGVEPAKSSNFSTPDQGQSEQDDGRSVNPGEAYHRQEGHHPPLHRSNPFLQPVDANGSVVDATELKTLLKHSTSAAFRVLGESSGMYIMRHLPHFVSGSNMIPSNDGYKDRNVAHVDHSLFRHLPHPSAYTIPSYATACKLVDAYFSNVHPIFPLAVPRQTIEVCVRETYRSHMPEIPEKSAGGSESSVLLLNAIFAVACKFSGKLELMKSSEIYTNRAEAMITSIWDSPGLQTVATIQTLLLIAMVEQASSRLGRSWIYVGHAIRIAQDLGLSVFQYANSPMLGMPGREWEGMRGAWWTCYVMDRILSAIMGRSITIHDEDIPTDFDEMFHPEDTYAGEDWPTTSTPAPGDRHVVGDRRTDEGPKGDMATQQFVYLITLSTILGKVTTHVNSHNWHLRMEERLKPIQEEIMTWLAKLPKWFRYDVVLRARKHNEAGRCHTEAEALAVSPFAWFLQFWYHTTIILLHRPYITLPLPHSTGFAEVTRRASLGICTGSATAITNLLVTIPLQELAAVPSLVVYCLLTVATIHLNNLHFADGPQQSSGNVKRQQAVENGREPRKALCKSAKAGLQICLRNLEGLSAYFPIAGKCRGLIASFGAAGIPPKQKESGLSPECQDSNSDLHPMNSIPPFVNVDSQPFPNQFPGEDCPLLFQELMQNLGDDEAAAGGAAAAVMLDCQENGAYGIKAIVPRMVVSEQPKTELDQAFADPIAAFDSSTWLPTQLLDEQVEQNQAVEPSPFWGVAPFDIPIYHKDETAPSGFIF